MGLAKPERKPLIVLLVKRTAVFLLAVCALLVFIYAIGTAQDFLDSTQSFIIRGLSAIGLLLAVGSAYGFAIDIWIAVASRATRHLFGALSYLVLVFIGLGAAAFSAFLLSAIAGNAP
ncbi:MAG: hypothetical protein A2Z99_11855 [Treponema sp. GWB1_62_6]|nr:MAG: hypothetical protein A2Z99_11855 [Treponema sp. GWB1_62_6]OHE69215.1 MAG: hypothetical protein A2001_13525 [Treponema sp. GWC1_61_84]OHE71085.1 MAG: hypothetical protein A2413_17155 [Treponema sp. RIFOXYC1_FULL_61_9]HCM26160.1 hypothetical protein [Treponema sp.]